MEHLRIGVKDDTNGIVEQILSSIKFEKNKNIDYKFRKNTKRTKLNYLDIFFKNKFNKLLKVKFGTLISDWIVKKYENQMLVKIINKKCMNFSKVEKNEILLSTIQKNENEKDIKLTKRRNEIKNKISEYLESYNQIYIDGFIYFRLREYWGYLEEIVNMSVRDYKLDKEYSGFIKLLRYFIRVQKPKLDFLHVVVQKNLSYNFYNKFLVNITCECKKDFDVEIENKKINYDDVLLSVVIVLAPKKVVIHRSSLMKNKELMNTLDAIFGKKIKFCEECDFCKEEKN